METTYCTGFMIEILLFLLSKFSVFEASPPPRDPNESLPAHLLVVAQHNTVRGHLDTGLGRDVLGAKENILVIEATLIISRVQTFTMAVTPHGP